MSLDTEVRDECHVLSSQCWVVGVHHAETVDDHVGLLAAAAEGTSPRATSRSSQDLPCGLPYSATTPRSGSHPATATRSTASAACADERRGLGAPRFLRHGGIGQQLGQAAR